MDFVDEVDAGGGGDRAEIWGDNEFERSVRPCGATASAIGGVGHDEMSLRRFRKQGVFD